MDANLLVSPQELTQFFETEFSSISETNNKSLLEEVELYVPGKVISIWNHTNDPSIISGKVTNGNSQVLKKIFVEKNMLSDHSCDTYTTVKTV